MYCFRHRFEFPRSRKIGIEENAVTLWQTADDQRVRLVSLDADSLKDSSSAAIVGEGFTSASDALVAAKRWRGILTRSFAGIQLGADFEDRAARGGLSDFVREGIFEEHGRSVLNDYGLNVFDCEPPPLFDRVGSAGLVVSARENWLRALDAAMSVPEISDIERLAYDIYASAFVVQFSAEARFMLLMMALETLIEQAERDAPTRSHVDRLIEVTRISELPNREKASIAGSLQWLYVESVTRAGKKLAATLGDRTYNNETPPRFFAECYDVRSKLVHGHSARPGRDVVGRLAANLETFVGDLLAGSNVVAATRPQA